MGVFYLISLPMTLGMVVITLKYFAAPHVRLYVFFTVGYAWFCSLSIIFIVPADIWTTMVNRQNWVIAFFWSWSYWSTFLLTWAVVPLLQDYEDAGDFTVAERLKTSIHRNLVFYLIVGSIGLIGLILLVIMRRNLRGGALGFAMACSNTFGLVTGAFLLGFGLSEIPRSLWKKADWTFRQKALSHKIADMAVKLDDAHRNFSNAIVVAQATSNQMSKRDPLRPCMDVIDKMVAQMFKEDPSFKPQGGRLGENDMDYDADVKSMAELRRQLRVAQEQYYRYKSEYMTCVLEALELEDTIKNYEQRDATGWFVALLSMTFIIFPLLLPCLPQTDLIFRQSLTGGFIVSRHKKYISSLRGTRPGNVGSILDTAELLWRCILRKQLQRLLSIILGCMSVAILLAEATLLPSVDLSLFSILIKSAHRHELLVQVFAFIPLMYMCVCTYYSLFKVGMMAFYSLTPRQTSSVSLFMIVSMVARYAPPISYNFLNLIRLDGNAKTIFEQRMGNIDDAVPFFGTGFNRLYPLIMVIYTILVASNFFDRIIGFFGSWKILKFQSEADDVGGFDPSGMIILHRERLWLEQGHKVGEQVIPLARNFSNIDVDDIEAEPRGSLLKDDGERSSRLEIHQYSGNRELISNKSAAIREENRQTSSLRSAENTTSSAKVSLLNSGSSDSTACDTGAQSSGLSSTWQTMKTGFHSFRAKIGSKKFLPLKQAQETTIVLRDSSSSESLDDIFQRLKRPPLEHVTFSDDEDDDFGIKDLSSRR